MHIDPDSLSIADRYKLLIGGIVPRPIAFVSTISPSGRLNLAPFSFFNGISANPMTLLFCPANKPDGTEKDTLRNIAHPWTSSDQATGAGEFVVNVVSEAIALRAVACAEELSYGESEFDFAGLAPAPSSVVAPPRVAESPLSFECRCVALHRLNPGAPAGGNIVIGKVIAVHAHEGLINDRFHVDPEALRAVGRMGGASYCTTRQRFEVPMGRPALDLPALDFTRMKPAR